MAGESCLLSYMLTGSFQEPECVMNESEVLNTEMSLRNNDSFSYCCRVPRDNVKFLGTVRFASRNCHRLKEQGRCDDLEAWLFMIFEAHFRGTGSFV